MRRSGNLMDHGGDHMDHSGDPNIHDDSTPDPNLV
jgi:hypothetical protein